MRGRRIRDHPHRLRQQRTEDEHQRQPSGRRRHVATGRPGVVDRDLEGVHTDRSGLAGLDRQHGYHRLPHGAVARDRAARTSPRSRRRRPPTTATPACRPPPPTGTGFAPRTRPPTSAGTPRSPWRPPTPPRRRRPARSGRGRSARGVARPRPRPPATATSGPSRVPSGRLKAASATHSASTATARFASRMHRR